MHTARKGIMRASRVAALAAGLVALAASAGSAQQSAQGPRWQAWAGCWTAAPSSADALLPAAQSAPVVCVVPTSNSDVVEVSTIADGKVVSHTRIDASGREQPVELKGCTGTQRAQWSADERRVFLKAVTTCDGLQRTTSGILAMSPTGEWLDVQGVTTGGGDNLRVARYRDAGVPASVPADIAAALNGRSESVRAARIAAGANVGTSAVVEASRIADAAVVEGWLLERRQPFALDANALVALADAGVPARVTDAIVAVSNPKAFAIARPDRAAEGVIEADDIAPAGRRIPVRLDPWSYDPYGYGSYGLGSYYGGYGYGLGYGGSYGGYGYPGYYYGSPIIVVPGPTAGAAHGRMVKGRGYTKDGEASGRATSSSPSWSSPSSGSGTSSGSSSGSSSSGSSTRTAKPRP
jgi:hypothetical protein